MKAEQNTQTPAKLDDPYRWSGLVLSWLQWTSQTRVTRQVTELAIKTGALRLFVDENDLVHASVLELQKAQKLWHTHPGLFECEREKAAREEAQRKPRIYNAPQSDLQVQAERERARLFTLTWDEIESKLGRSRSMIRAAVKEGPPKPSLRCTKAGIRGTRDDLHTLGDQVAISFDERGLCGGS